MACFAPGESLPRSLLVESYTNGGGHTSGDHTGGGHGGAALQVEDAIERLVNVGLLETGAGDTLRMHRLLVAFTHTTMDTASARADVERTMIAEARRRNDAGYPDRMLTLQVHLRAVTDVAKERADAEAADLCEVLGWHLVLLGSYQEPQSYLEHSLAIREAVFGDCHAAVASSLNVLGLMLQFQGKFVQAEPYYKRAVAIWEQRLGPQHPETITGYNNLGYVMVDEGKLEEAQPYLEQALRLREHVLGANHPDTARSLNNMGFLLLQQGECAAAQAYLERALAVRESLLGDRHPAFVLTLTNLGRVLSRQGLYAEARTCFERALDIYDTLYSSPNIGPAETVRFLSVVLWAQGERDQAWRLARQALDTCMSAVGLDHSDTAHCLYHIGTLYDKQADIENARAYYQQALPIYEISFAPQHRKLQALRARLAEIDSVGQSPVPARCAPAR
jgi:tetratricopeptide (TPR) repeat protein